MVGFCDSAVTDRIKTQLEHTIDRVESALGGIQTCLEQWNSRWAGPRGAQTNGS